MLKLTSITIVVIVAAGCVANGLPDGADGGTPLTGGYSVTVAPATGNCQPPPLTGPVSGKTFVVVKGDAMVVSVPATQDGSILSYRTVDVVDGQSDATVDDSGSTWRERLTISNETANGFTATRYDTWSNVAAYGSGDGGAHIPPPAADCTSAVELQYTLVTACPAPCTLRLIENFTDTSFGCDCPDGGGP
jgi:hypothetical protein